MSFNDTEKRIIDIIDKNSDKIISTAKKILANPELGYKEFDTSKLIFDELSALGLSVTDGHAITGVKGVLGNEDGFNVCIIGEMDSVVNFDHPNAVFPSGAAHACGHHAQAAAMLGAAIGLTGSGVINEIKNGAVTFLAVPAEEYIELEYRQKLKDNGKIKYYSGKEQLIYEGVFDGIDAAIMIHAQPDAPENLVCLDADSLGFVVKQVTFKGKSVHAAKPYDGVNALNAAALAILGIHTCRERFKDEDKIRAHFIITKGGDIVNAVPSEVTMECQVRSANLEGLKKASIDVDNAIKGAAMMVGAEVEIETTNGYLPFMLDKNLGKVFGDVASGFMAQEFIKHDISMTGSSDIGDLSHLIPAIQPMVGGFSGQLHAKEFCASDDYTAYVLPAKLMALTAYRLLENDCKLGKEIKADFVPKMSKEEYLNYLNS